MLIAFYIPYYREGGVETTTHRLAREFRRRGHEVDLLTFSHDSPYLGADSPFNVVDLAAGRTASSVPRVVSYLRRNNPDGLISTHYFANVCAVIAREIACSNTYLILTERLSISQSLRKEPLIKRHLFPPLMWLTYPQADSRVTVSKDAAAELSDLLSLSRESVMSIYNPTLDDSVYERARETVDHPWFDEGHVLVSAGRLTPQKDFETLLRSLAAIDCEDFFLIVLGEGERRSFLEGLSEQLGIDSRVDFLGYVDNPYKYMQAGDLFVLSSQYEGMPNVLVEALALGTPAVATDCPTGPRELLEDGKYGPLVPVGDSRAMAEAIKAQLADLEQARKRVRKLQPKLEQFRPENASDRYLDLIGEEVE